MNGHFIIHRGGFTTPAALIESKFNFCKSFTPSCLFSSHPIQQVRLPLSTLGTIHVTEMCELLISLGKRRQYSRLVAVKWCYRLFSSSVFWLHVYLYLCVKVWKVQVQCFPRCLCICVATYRMTMLLATQSISALPSPPYTSSHTKSEIHRHSLKLSFVRVAVECSKNPKTPVNTQCSAFCEVFRQGRAGQIPDPFCFTGCCCVLPQQFTCNTLYRMWPTDNNKTP